MFTSNMAPSRDFAFIAGVILLLACILGTVCVSYFIVFNCTSAVFVSVRDKSPLKINHQYEKIFSCKLIRFALTVVALSS